ncbi:MAG TPA: T9SS type B sorting domain-containing protein [Chitinophagaceae bacterium]|nr:T9SS type B sorting domain-containing protein [Chitinophagaceae bacterium]
MSTRITYTVLLILLQSLYSSITRAQSVGCPPNIDFETGDFTNWECKTGIVSAATGDNVISWYGTGQQSDRHTMISAADGGLDPYGNFPMRCPNGSGFSVKLGNNSGGAEAEGVFYNYTIPATNNNFSIIYYYAVVFEDPGHLPYQQPRFRARVIDIATNTEINCVSFDFTAGAGLPGFLSSPVAPGVLYKEWTPITVDLSEYAGHSIRLEFITSDCTFTRHFGYAYIDVDSRCNGSILGSTLCQGDTSVNLVAPFGFQDYLWYSDNTFSNLIGNNQELLVNPAPPVGTVYPVIVIPYQGFGCADTLYADINRAPKPNSEAGADKITCSKQRVQIGDLPTPNYLYTWTPLQFLTSPTVANPYALPDLVGPTKFIVKTTDAITGCFALDSMVVTPIHVDTTSNLIGRTIYCPGDPSNAVMSVPNSLTSVQWFKNNTLIPGATNFTYQPATGSTGYYWAQVTQFGCTDSTRQHVITISPLPKVNFELNRDIQCLNLPIPIKNTTRITTNESLTYTWKFGDGTLSTDPDVIKTYTSTGDFNIKLIATSVLGGCTDSTQKVITILEKCYNYLPSAFTPNGDNLNDYFMPILVGEKRLKRFAVYNRYGNMIFSTTKEGVGWNGEYLGIKQDSAVFVWLLEFINNDNSVTVEKGVVTLIR